MAEFIAAFRGERPHHAWLLCGPSGLGKAAFADGAGTWLLAGCPDGHNFAVADSSNAANLIRASAHPDFRRLQPTINEKGKLSSYIRIDEVRAIQPLLNQKPAFDGWRVVVVDSADLFTKEAANALLKSLEEPLPNTVFLMVCHSLSRLPATIRSRCRVLRFQPLADVEIDSLLADTGIGADDRVVLVRLAQGCPGRALAFAEAGIAALERDLQALAPVPAREAVARAQAVARTVVGKTAAGRYEALLIRAPAILAEAARQRRGAALARVLDDYDAARKLAAEAVPLGLVPEQVAFDLCRRVAALSG